MVQCVCAPSIKAELADWVALGGGNSGCCGDANHTSGFHLPAGNIPTSDYSRRHDPGSPVNMSWACAGDFAHRGNAGLRARHAEVLARLQRGELPMICEFIGKPFADRPVLYWARWNGIATIKNYTGSGHDTWSHISWWRSRADERAYLWTGGGGGGKTPPSTHPPYPGYVMVKNPDKYDANVRVFQQRMRDRGWTIGVDGYFGNQTYNVVTSFQKEKNLGVDGKIGPITWNAAWTAPIT